MCNEGSVEELLHIVAEERASRTSDEVAAAEAEITRRLGGTREQARRRLVKRGLSAIVVGLLIVIASLLVAMLEADDAADFVAAGIAALVGLVIIGLGLAVMTAKKWVLRKSPLMPIVRRADVQALTAEPPLEDLLRTLGSDGDAQSAEGFAAARDALAERLSTARERTIKRVRKWGLIAIMFGLYMGVAGTGMMILLTVTALKGPEAYPMGETLAGALHMRLMSWMGIINTCVGWGLFASGIGLRKRREWARKTIIWIFWIWFACGLTLTPVWAALMLSMTEDVGGMLFILALLSLSVALWVAILRSITKPLSRPEIREVCRPSLREEDAGARRRFRRRMILIATVPVALPLLAPIVAYGVWWQRSAAELDAEMQALRESGAVIDLQKWKPPLPAADENGAELASQAFSMLEEADNRLRESALPAPEMPDGDEFEGWWDLLSLDSWTPEQAAYAETVLLHQHEALATLRQAAARPHLDFDWDYGAQPAPSLWEMGRVERASNLVALSARFNLHNGDYARAVADVELALRLARFPDGDPVLYVQIVRTENARDGARCCERILRSPEPAADPLQGLDRLLLEARQGLSLQRALECERAWLISCWRELEAGKWEILEHDSPSWLKEFLLQPLLRSQMAAALRLANEAVLTSGEPPWQALPRMEALEMQVELEWEMYPWGDSGRRLCPNPIRLLPGYEHTARPYASCDALLDSLRIAIALRRYRADKGQPAETLENLAPEYLPELPRDPYSGKAFLVRRGEGMVTVYSVGDNMEDDGGRVEEEGEYHERPDIGVRIVE